MTLVSINPTTGEEIASYTEMTSDEVEEVVGATHESFQSWRQTPFAERSRLLAAAAAVLEEERDHHAELMVREMGKPILQARAEVDKCAWVCRYYAENGESFLAPEPVETDATRSYVAFEPLGVVLAVMPWNFPYWQVFRFAAPALMAGNTGLLKHASNVQGCALAIEEIFHRAGFPEQAFRTLVVGSSRVAAIIEDPRVKAVTLTGSTPAGKAVAGQAGSLLKKTLLELGGSDPYVLLEDADLDLAVGACVTGRLLNTGQSCIAAKRFIVPESLLAEFEQRCSAEMESKVMGDPMDEATDIGPLARLEFREELHRQVRESLDAGARLLLGGEIPDGPGAFYPPTLLTAVRAGMPAYAEELFGPVAAILPVKDEEEALRVANDTPFGLGAAVFTRDQKRGEEIARHRLDAGSCFVNAFVKSDPRLPFGGIKESGYGRELSRFGIREFVNIKTVYVA
ncbi:MAG: NAD-dependent succinate-semialdehyde dehydrogenase [Thermoanaerobaculia bacterium]